MIFHDVAFDDGFLTATHADGTIVRFTRHERALLSLFAQQPGRLFTREALFKALASRGSDRNVDWVVNRLRGKLADTGPERRFISTHYGEGYVWEATATREDSRGEFVVVGPLRGLRDEAAQAVLHAFQTALQDQFGDDHRVCIAADLAADARGAHSFSVDVSIYPAAGRLHTAFVLRHAPSHEVVATFRESFAGEPAPSDAGSVAGGVAEAAWRHLALGSRAAATPTDPPLHLRLEAASALLDPAAGAWAANGERIAALRAKDPADPMAAVLWAMQLFGRMTVDPGPEPLRRADIDALGDEIEGLVLEHLAAVRDDPLMALAAAKLLLGVQRGHEDLAESLATAALAGSTAFAAALSMLGQISAYRGDLAKSTRLYDEGLQLCERGSPFEAYIQVLKAQTLIAIDDRPGVEAIYQRLLEISPAALQRFALLFLPLGDDGLARKLAPVLDRTSEGRARRTVAYLHYLVARHFGSPDHAANIMRGPLIHLVRRFGPDVVSEAIWSEMPTELHYLRTARAFEAPVGPTPPNRGKSALP
ncbi:MAG: winged helix-turn-helix domain-containing protein [Phenylobacterium sp.]